MGLAKENLQFSRFEKFDKYQNIGFLVRALFIVHLLKLAVGSIFCFTCDEIKTYLLKNIDRPIRAKIYIILEI